MRKTVHTPVLFFGIILFIVLCTAAYIVLDYRNKSREHSKSIGRESLQIEAVTLEYFDKYLSVLRTLSEMPCIREKNGRACDALLKKLNSQFPGVVNFAALDSKGYFFASGMPFDRADPPSIRKLEFFTELQGGIDTYIMNPHMGPISDVKVSGIITRLFDRLGNPNGFVGVSIRFSELENLWRKSAALFDHAIIVADRTALIHFASAPFTSLIGKKLPEIGIAAPAESGGRGEVSVDSNRYTIHVRELKYGGLILVELSPLYSFTGVYADEHPQVLYVGIALLLAVIVSFLVIGQANILTVKLSTAEKASYRLMEMIERSPFALVASSAENNAIEMVNEACASLYGYEPEELMNKGVSQLYAPEAREDIPEIIATVREKGFHRFESLHVRKDGSRFPVEAYVAAVRDERGTIIGRIANIQDITRRKQTEEALRRSEEKFNKAFHNSPDAITITRASDGLLIDVNAALVRLSGYTHGEVVGQTSVALDLWVNAVDRDRYVSTLGEKGRVVDFEADFRTKSGDIRNCLLSGEIYEAGGETLILGIIRDITQQRQTARMLAESEAKYRAFFENSMDAILLTSPDGAIQAANPAACRMLERTEEEICALGRGGLLDRTDPRLPVILSERAKKGKASGELTMLRGDGAPFPVEISSALFQDSAGNQRTSMIVRDISERKKAEEALHTLASTLEQRVKKRTAEYEESQAALLNLVDDMNRTTEELAEANAKLHELDRLKSMFIASMSHELRTPLNSIIGFTGIILMGMSGPISSAQKKQLGMVKNSANHLLALINDVIDVSKIEAGKVDLDIEDFDLSHLDREVMESFSVSAADKGLRLDLKAADEIWVRSDRRRVRQILVNLIGNAVKFTTEGGVAVSISETAGEVEIRISDTGIGIKPEDMERLFGAFSRIHIQDQPIVEGTGLGLYLSRRIATLLGGAITAESEFGRGCEFILHLPRVRQEDRR